MMQLVEPPTAMASATALSKDAALRISDGLRSSQTISTIRRPVWLAMRAWPESAAGIELAPGRVRPSVSAIAPMVEAVPMVMQRSEEHTSELQSLMRISYAVFCLKKKNHKTYPQ